MFLLLLLSAWLPVAAAADVTVDVNVPLFAIEGASGEFKATVSRAGVPVDDAVVIFDVYTVQGIDSGTHDAQMREMADIEAGRKPAPVFRLGDVKLGGEPERLVGALRGRGVYVAPYRFPHGRIFVKVTTIAGGTTQISPILSSTRIHCDQVQLDGFERQKTFLDHAREIVDRGHLATLEPVAAAMRRDLDTGHSLRYMVVHHEKDPRPYDEGVAALALAARDTDATAARNAVERLEQAYGAALAAFLSVTLRADGAIIAGRVAPFTLTLYDAINRHPLRTSLVVVQPEIDRSSETHSRAAVLQRQLETAGAAGQHHGHAYQAAPTASAVPAGIVPRANPDGSFGFSHAFATPGDKLLRLNVYYDGRQFTHDVPLTVRPEHGRCHHC